MNAPAPPVMNVPEDMNALALSEMNASAEMNAPDDTNGMEPDERDMIIAEILKSAPDDTNEMEPDERDMIIDEILKSPDSKLSTRASTSGSMHSPTTLGGSSSTTSLSRRLTRQSKYNIFHGFYKQEKYLNHSNVEGQGH